MTLNWPINVLNNKYERYDFARNTLIRLEDYELFSATHFEYR